MTSDLKKCFVEFVGTFFLCFTVLCCVMLSANPTIAALTIGLVLAILVYAGGPVSGAHYNPAVSLGIFLIGRMGAKKTCLYCFFQIFGAAYAALIAFSLSSVFQSVSAGDFKIGPLMVGEIVFTTLLVYVVMFTAVSKRVQGNNYFGFAIGSAVAVGIGAVGTICLTAFNPAVALALLITKVAVSKIVWITILANLIASVVAAVLFRLLTLDDVEKVEVVGIDEFIRK